MNPIDSFLNKITMYRLLLYGLLLLAAFSLILSIFGQFFFGPLELILLILTLTFTCFFSNLILAKIFKAVINAESALITSFILFFLLMPSARWEDLLIYAAAGVSAMASKYIIAVNKKHIFNPAAFGAFVIFFLNSGALWWVATSLMLPAMLIFGFLVIRKIRKIRMFAAFFATALVILSLQVILKGLPIQSEIVQFLTSFPVIFFGTVMLTEPLTTPPSHKMQYVYAVLVGFLFSLQIPIHPIPLSPELALLIGNIFTFAVSPKYKLFLHQNSIRKIGDSTFEICFDKPKDFVFKAGQYLEWTVPMKKTDSRGNRRYFTIASSPTENQLKLGIKHFDPPSAFKKLLINLTPQTQITATQLAGEFTLPKDSSKKLLFIAGGIGVTPFRSMIKYILDTGQKRDIVLFYSNKSEQEIVYRDDFDEAQKNGIKITYILTEKVGIPENFTGETGRIDSTMIKKHVPDFSERIIYLSGPNAMVNNYKKLLLSMGVKYTNIKTDYFPGF